MDSPTPTDLDSGQTTDQVSVAGKKRLTKGETVVRFIEKYCLTPEGAHVGKPIRLEEFQKRFLLAVYDNPAITRRAILSIARKNGKSALIAAIVLCHVLGPLRQRNSQIISGAMSRGQAALVFKLAVKMLNLQPAFKGLYANTRSEIRGIQSNVVYWAISAEASTAHGLSPVVAILDEIGQVRGPTSPFIDAVTTSQGAHAFPLVIAISTQAPSDADLLSLWIDDALRSGDPSIVCHIYAADKDCDLLDKTQWRKANPALGAFRSFRDLEEQLKQADRMPSSEAAARNLLLNQRISLQSLWLAPRIWKENGGEIDLKVFQRSPVSIGLDLSVRHDLTAAVLAARDEDGVVHLFPFVFIPSDNLDLKESRDRAPYAQWIRSGHLIAVPGPTLDYDWLVMFLKLQLEKMEIKLANVEFDRWRIKELQNAAARQDFAQDAEWHQIGQGYQSMSPRIEFFETLLLQTKIRHGMHPLMNMAAANAIVVRDPAGNRKIDKAKSTQRIDPLVSAVMACGVFMVIEPDFDASSWIG